MADPPPGVKGRRARNDDRVGLLHVLAGAMLAIEVTTVEEHIERGDALVAAAEGRFVGALLRDGARIEAVVARRNRGIGRALVERAGGATGRLAAAFDDRARSFYETLGFEIEERTWDGRLYAVRK